MKTKRSLNLIAAALLAAVAFTTTIARAADPSSPKGIAAASAPRLILQITVDQLRGDLPGRYLKNMGEGGYRYLMDHGVWYADAHHESAKPERMRQSERNEAGGEDDRADHHHRPGANPVE